MSKTYRRPSGMRPGRPPRSGARWLSRYLRANMLDRRTWVSREVEAIEMALAEDEGGLDALSAAQAHLLPVLSAEALVLGAAWNEIKRRIVEKKSVEELGVSKWLLALSNTYARHLVTFRDLRGPRERVPDLGEYLRQRAQAQAAGNDHNAGQGNGRTGTPAAPGANGEA